MQPAPVAGRNQFLISELARSNRAASGGLNRPANSPGINGGFSLSSRGKVLFIRFPLSGKIK
jgi:hypothetical protein